MTSACICKINTGSTITPFQTSFWIWTQKCARVGKLWVTSTRNSYWDLFGWLSYLDVADWYSYPREMDGQSTQPTCLCHQRSVMDTAFFFVSVSWGREVILIDGEWPDSNHTVWTLHSICIAVHITPWTMTNNRKQKGKRATLEASMPQG